jgi:hypothetical protein
MKQEKVYKRRKMKVILLERKKGWKPKEERREEGQCNVQ